MTGPATARGRWLAAFAAGLAAQLGGAWALADGPDVATAWPAAGVSLAMIVLFGRGVVSAVLASALAGNLFLNLPLRGNENFAGVGLSLAAALGQTAEAWLAAEWVVRRGNGPDVLRRGADFFRFAAVILLTHLVGALAGAATLFGLGRIGAEILGAATLTWWAGTTVGAVVFALPIFLAGRADLSAFYARSDRLKAIGLLALTFVSGHMVAEYGAAPSGNGMLGAFLVIPLVLWIGFAFRGPGVAAALLVFYAIVVAAPFPGYAAIPGLNGQLALLHGQVLVGIVALVGFGFVALLDERDAHVAEVEKLNADLEGKVKARMRQLECLNQELTDTMSVVAHDVRGPVAGIRTLAHHMRWSSLDLSTAEGNELLGEIERTSATAVAMMARLLDLQRANDRPGMPVAADLGLLAMDVCRAHENSAREKGIALRFVPPRSKERRLVDVEGVKFIAANLVSNAIKFLPAGGAVEVRVDASDFNCRLVVADDGPGIGTGECRRIFQRFVKASNRPTGGESSTGLGLFIVRKLVLAMRGTLYVESAPAEGTTFVVEWSADREPPS